jgi:hypothetical protein
MPSTLGISEVHSRNTSGVQATRCCSVPRFSCAKAGDPANSSAAIITGCSAPAPRTRARNPAIFESTSPMARPVSPDRAFHLVPRVHNSRQHLKVRFPQERLDRRRVQVRAVGYRPRSDCARRCGRRATLTSLYFVCRDFRHHLLTNWSRKKHSCEDAECRSHVWGLRAVTIILDLIAVRLRYS